MDDNSQADLDALTAIIAALKKLDSTAQERTLQAVATFLGLAIGRTSPSSTSSSATVAHSSFNPASESSFSEDRSISPKEFLRDKRPMSDVDRVACLGYYLTHYMGTQHFKTVDISALNTEAAQPKFSNASMAVDNATKAGLLVQVARGAKQLSAYGEQYVQLLPNRDAARASLKDGRPKRKAKRTNRKATP